MLQAGKLFALLLPIFLAIDLFWLGIVMKSFYSTELGPLARRAGDGLAPRWGAALLVYLLIPGGLVLFVRPLLQNGGTIGAALGWGALYGLVVYGVYDLTNRAILENWSLRMTIADIIWGCVLCGITSLAMWRIDLWLKS
jgi:uncharacterized membrane protein